MNRTRPNRLNGIPSLLFPVATMSSPSSSPSRFIHNSLFGCFTSWTITRKTNRNILADDFALLNNYSTATRTNGNRFEVTPPSTTESNVLCRRDKLSLLNLYLLIRHNLMVSFVYCSTGHLSHCGPCKFLPKHALLSIVLVVEEWHCCPTIASV